MATFTPPLSEDRMMTRWKGFVDEVKNGTRIIFIQTSNISERNTVHGVDLPFAAEDWPTINAELEVAGVISLSMPTSETGPFRGLVQNLFVHPFHRRKGVATALLKNLEKRALQAGRWSLMLDTTVGTPAEKMYETLRWNKLGVVKDYGYRLVAGHDTLELVDEVWFWKDLRQVDSV